MENSCKEIKHAFTIISRKLFLDIYLTDSNIIFVCDERNQLSRESMQTGGTDPQEIRNDQASIFQKIKSYRFCEVLVVCSAGSRKWDDFLIIRRYEI